MYIQLLFCTRFDQFESLVIPFGLKNALATFMTIMDIVLRSYLGKFKVIFLDDILIYSSTKEEHFQYLSQVFDLICCHKIYDKASKFDFLRPKVHYLRHIIFTQGVQMDMIKVNAIMHWPSPTNLEEL